MNLALRVAALILALPLAAAAANTKLQGYCEQGGQTATVAGVTSSTKVQRSYPSCTVTVYNAGTVTLSTIYSDSAGTAKANPFTAASTGLWFFYGPAGTHYDVQFSNGGITSPFTIGDLATPTMGAEVSGSNSFLANGAVGNGTTNDATAIQTTLNAAPASGGAFGTSLTYAVTSLLTIGNGTGNYTTGAATASTVNNYIIDGGGATIKYTGGSTASAVLTINGPITGISIRNLTIDCNGLAGIGLDLNHVAEAHFENVYIKNNTGFGIRHRAYSNPTSFTNGANNNTFENVWVNSTQTGSGGITIGYTDTSASPRLDVAQNHFNNCRFRFDGAGGTTVGIQLNFTDALTFTNTLTYATVGVQVVPPSGTSGASYPSGIQFSNCPLTGSAAVSGAVTWAGTSGLFFWRFPTADGEALPPLTPVGLFSGIDDTGKFFGRAFTQFPVYNSAITTSAAVTNTTAETAFSISYTVPAYVLSVPGTIVRIKTSGLYSTTGTPTLTFRAKLGGNTCGDPVMGTASGAANFAWSFASDCIIRATGASGTVFPGANWAGVGGFGNGTGAGSASASINTTVTNAVTVTVQWGTASASNTIQMTTFTVEVLYPGSN